MFLVCFHHHLKVGIRSHIVPSVSVFLLGDCTVLMDLLQVLFFADMFEVKIIDKPIGELICEFFELCRDLFVEFVSASSLASEHAIDSVYYASFSGTVY